MKTHIKLSVFLFLCCLTVHGQTVVDTDSIQLPAKVTELPNVIKELGPFTLGQDRSGIWAMPTLVALQYGLEINDTIDERFDEEASTRAATAYFNDLYAEFGDWDLCYIAYLYSPAYVRNLQLRHLDTIIGSFDIKHYTDHFKIKAEPRPVVKKPKVTKPKPKQEPKYTTYTVKSGDTLSKIAKKFKVSVADIKKWNNLKSDLIRENQKLKIKQ